MTRGTLKTKPLSLSLIDALMLKPKSRRILFFTFLLLLLRSQPLPPLKSTSSPIAHFPLLSKCLPFTSFVTQRDISFPKAPWERKKLFASKITPFRKTLAKTNGALSLRLPNLNSSKTISHVRITMLRLCLD